MRVLYVCYLGIGEPLVQSQVVPYLGRLRAGGVGVHLLTFEPKRGARDARSSATWRASLQAEGIAWSWLPYHKRPAVVATAYDIVRGVVHARRLGSATRFDLVHGRSHVGTAVGVLAREWVGGRVIFDVRGFLPEEYAAAGIWRRNGPVYRLVKRAERYLLREADGFVMLTERARAVVFPDAADGQAAGRPIEIIPCCVDTTRFTAPDARTRARAKAALGLSGRRVFVHLGSLDGWVNTEALAAMVAIAAERDPLNFTLILTHSRADRLEHELARRQVAPDRYAVRSVPPNAVPEHLHAADAGLATYLPDISKAVSSPTKIAEYLASGLPVCCTPGTGDIDAILASERIGAAAASTSDVDLSAAFDRCVDLLSDSGLPSRCRRVALDRFDLGRVGSFRYRRLYDRVLDARP